MNFLLKIFYIKSKYINTFKLTNSNYFCVFKNNKKVIILQKNLSLLHKNKREGGGYFMNSDILLDKRGQRQGQVADLDVFFCISR